MAYCSGKPFSCDPSNCINPVETYNWTVARVIGVQSLSLTTASATGTATTLTSGVSLGQGPDCPSEGTSRKTIGIGVGLGLGLPLLITTACFAGLWHVERRKRLHNDIMATTMAREDLTKEGGEKGGAEPPASELGVQPTWVELDGSRAR
ncbi:hypothetical protein MMC16_001010 [Acarospora aff. strigata]|nr:hypothetical protein [Acarospora aff. strigata]